MTKLRLSLLLAAAVGIGALPGQARPPATNAWQPIIFSSPDNAEISSNVMSHSTQSSSSGLQSKLNLVQDASPVANFNNPPLPTVPVLIPNQVRWIQRLPNDSRDWEFMTPAEILGVAPNQTLETQKRDANGDQVSPTSLERYLERQNPSSEFNANLSDSTSPSWNWSNGQTNEVVSGLFGSNLGSDMGDNGNLSWSKLFGSPLTQAKTPTPAPNQEATQATAQGDMSQFMQLLNPGSTPDTTAAAMTAPGETTSPQAQMVLPDSDATEALANPIGASFAPLSIRAGKPIGLAPLPTITRQPSAQSVPSAWAPQPPPWLLTTPQPFAVPRSKF